MSKIQLVLPRASEHIAGAGVLPPLGLISIATFLKSRMSNVVVEVIDGELLPPETLINKLDGSFLGISVTHANYKGAIALSKEAKHKGMRIVLGGPHATTKHKEILKCQDCIDERLKY